MNRVMAETQPLSSMSLPNKKAEKTRTHFTFRIDTWTKADSHSIVEYIAGVEDYELALGTFRLALRKLARHPVTSRLGGVAVLQTSKSCSAVPCSRYGAFTSPTSSP